MIATTVNKTDDPVVELAETENVAFFRADEHDVLGRYVGAARQSNADVVIRSTADCPLIDAEVTDSVIRETDLIMPTNAITRENYHRTHVSAGVGCRSVFFRYAAAR